MQRRSVEKVTPTPRGTVLVPFEALNGAYVVVELTAANWRRIVADVNHGFALVRHNQGIAADIADIDKWEALT